MWLYLLGKLDVATRARIVAVGVASLAARLVLVWAALRFAAGDVAFSVLLGGVGSLLYLLARSASTDVRLRAESELYAATAHAVLDGDVLQVPEVDLPRVTFETSGLSSQILSVTFPATVADVLASMIVAPLLLAAFPPRMAVGLALAVIVILVSLLALRGVNRRLQQAVQREHEAASDAFLLALEGRLELVSRGADRAYRDEVRRSLLRYANAASRAGVASSLLGRAPLALGALAVVAVLGSDASVRASAMDALASQALVLAACLPILLGAVLGSHELVRAGTRVTPLVRILRQPRRVELAPEAGTRRASLPASVSSSALTFAYRPDAAPTLLDVRMAWDPRRPLLITGPNGSGKSTLLRLLIGLRPPTHGQVLVDSHDLAEHDLIDLRRQVALLPQRAYLGEAHRTLGDAMRLGNAAASDETVVRALERTGVLAALSAHGADPLTVRVGELSSGQRQRVALARVLLGDPRLVLLDEPDANLDQEGIGRVVALVEELVQEGRMVAIAAHGAALGALDAERIVLPARSKETVIDG